MKEVLMKKFEELFGSTEGARFYFFSGTRESDRRTHRLQRKSRISMRIDDWYIRQRRKNVLTVLCGYIL